MNHEIFIKWLFGIELVGLWLLIFGYLIAIIFWVWDKIEFVEFMKDKEETGKIPSYKPIHKRRNNT